MSETKKLYASMRGNSNARKHKTSPTATLSLRCNDADKARWQAAAKSESMSLNQWVVENLNKITA